MLYKTIIDGFDDRESGLYNADQILPNQVHDERSIPERSLWRAVIVQALSDCSSNSQKKELKYEKARAIAWINSGGEDFIQVCEFAGFEPDYVKKMAKDAIKRDCKWRKPAGYRKFLPVEQKRKRGRPKKIIHEQNCLYHIEM